MSWHHFEGTTNLFLNCHQWGYVKNVCIFPFCTGELLTSGKSVKLNQNHIVKELQGRLWEMQKNYFVSRAGWRAHENHNNNPTWPNGYGISLLNWRLGVQVPPWVITLFSQLFLFNQWFYLFSCCSYECLVSFSIQFISVTTQIYSFTLFDLLVYV